MQTPDHQPIPTDRREFLKGGLTAVAGLTALGLAAGASDTRANTQHPPESEAGRARTKDGRFAGKVVLITGATSGIGETTAKAFAHEGAKVFFCGRREDLGAGVEKSIRDLGGEATYLKAGVRREEDVRAFVAGCVTAYGRVDIAFNNAGAINAKLARLHEQPTDDFLNVLHTNTLGEFLCLKHEIPVMLKQGGGCIVNMASVSGYKAFTEIGPYSISKHGVVGLTKVAALEYAKDNIRVTSIAPGGVDTPMLRTVRAQRGVTPEQISKSIPIGRTNTTEEMARAVMFLCSDEATAFHGANVDVTGGMLD